MLASTSEGATLSPTQSLGQGSCATTVAIAWRGKWQKHFLLHKSLAIYVGLGVLLAYEALCSQGTPYWQCSAVMAVLLVLATLHSS